MIFRRCLLSLALVTVASFSVHADPLKDLKFKGDLRLRYENINAEDSAQTDRYRLRARLGAKAQVSDHAQVNFRFTSGSHQSAITSTNQTMGDDPSYFANKSFELDIANLDYRPTDYLVVLAGKMKNPYYRPAKSGMIWDSDVTPEGIAVIFKSYYFDLLISEMQVDRNSSGLSYELVAGQLMSKAKFDNSQLTYGVGYYGYPEVKGNTLFKSQKGNTLEGGSYKYDFNTSQIFVDYKIDGYALPVSLFAEGIVNSGATENNKGHMAGVSVGGTKDPGSWKVTYLFQRLEADATIGLFTDGDFAGGGTDGEGHKVIVDYKTAKLGNLKLSHYNGKSAISGNNAKTYAKTHLDLILKF